MAMTSKKLVCPFRTEGVLPRIWVVKLTHDGVLRYILWAMEKYRLGKDPSEFAYEVSKKKKTRGCVCLLVGHGESLTSCTGGDRPYRMEKGYVRVGTSNMVKQSHPVAFTLASYISRSRASDLATTT